ncbi:MAG: hypothetical protein JSU75_04655 [Gammaproteobacteria bacterium]|nr:MAG: hypothetical protein JSU75_04655 [Gammaproteobacteria bacterium]
MEITWKLRTKEFIVFQFSAVSILVLLSLAAYLFSYYTGHGRLLGLIPFLDVSEEQSLPTYFSSLNLLLSSVLSFVLYAIFRREGFIRYRYWMYLSLLFLLLSVDEASSIHEKFTQLQKYTGILIPAIQTHSWILYGVLFTVVIGVFFIPFLVTLPARTALLMLLAGAIFLSGAIGVETLGAWFRYKNLAGHHDLIDNLRRLVEESLEMYSIALFNCILFREIATAKAKINIHPSTMNREAL